MSVSDEKKVIPLKVFTYKDGDEVISISCFTAAQVQEAAEYIHQRERFELECKEELDAIAVQWKTRKEKIASAFRV